jgi:hypothetical protein
MTQTGPAQSQPGYRPATEQPMDLVACGWCGALVAETDTDLHDRSTLASSARRPCRRRAPEGPSGSSLIRPRPGPAKVQQG